MNQVGGLAAAALDVLADLSTAAGPKGRSALSIPLEWFRWMPLRSEGLFWTLAAAPALHLDPAVLVAGHNPETPSIGIERGMADQLASIDQLRGKSNVLRVGWLFVAGTLTEGGKRRKVFHPLVTVPVRVVRPKLSNTAAIIAAGDVEMSSLLTVQERRRLEPGIEFGGGALVGDGATAPAKLLARLPKLQRFAMAAASAAGLPADRLVPVHGSPTDLMDEPGLTIVAGYGLFVTEDTNSVSRTSTLRSWTQQDVTTPTAFHTVYGITAEQPGAATASQPETAVDGPFVLSPDQREAVQRSRVDPLTVISGPPGCGKSHTIVAIACDAIARGEHVLVAAKSSSAVDALIDLLDRAPGPDPVVFGSNERRAALVRRLAAGHAVPTTKESVNSAQQERDTATAARDDARAAVIAALDAELAWNQSSALHDEAWAVAPGLLEPDVDLDHVAELLVESAGDTGGWWRRRRRRKARERLLALARAADTASLDDLARVAAISRARAAARALDAAGGLDLAREWQRLEPLDAAARDVTGQWLATDGRSPRRINRTTLGTIGALATALRSGRAARREQLAHIDPAALTTAFPLWIGTLDDIDDLLPARPASFDLVLLDEASSIDQPAAAPALLRGKRAVIVGDPRQLRHVSFVGDDAIAGSLQRHGLAGTDVGPRLDVRRNSIFDAAASAAPVTQLGEHYRSDPHLVDFVARRLYDGAVTIATHSPFTDSRDCVDAIRVDGRADGEGVIRAEIDAVLTALRRAADRGANSVGVVTPFRDQADALEQAILARFSADELEAMDVRVGTVHSFQGNERDIVLCSLGIGPTSTANSWRFAQDTHLLTVFLTRARRQLVFIHSCDPPPDGLLAAYLAESDDPPGTPTRTGQPTPWARRVTEQLNSAGLRLAVGYPIGRHVLDAVLLDAAMATPTALAIGVHPDGPVAHVDRHLALRRQGWRIEELFESRWGSDLAMLAIHVKQFVSS